MKFRIYIFIILGFLLFSITLNGQQLNKKAIVIYDGTEINNPRDWFGIWHLKGILEKQGFEYNQSEYRKINNIDLYDLYICYFEDEKIENFKKLYSILHTARKHERKIIFFGNLGVYFHKKFLNYDKYNRIINLCSLEDRSQWTDKLNDSDVKIDMDYFNSEFKESDIKNNITYFRYLFPFCNKYKSIIEVGLNGKKFCPVIITETGGYASTPFLVMKKGAKWKLALNLDKFIMDVTTFNNDSKSADSSRIINRKILVLFSTQLQLWRDNLFYKHFQLPLNYLGYDFTYVDINNTPDLTPYLNSKIIMTAFNVPELKRSREVMEFLVKSRAEKYIFTGYLPIYNEKGDSPHWTTVENFLRKFKVSFSKFIDLSKTSISKMNSVYYPFETKLELSKEKSIFGLTPTDNNNTVILQFKHQNKLFTPAYFNENSFFLLGDIIFDHESCKYYINFFEALRNFLDPEIIPLYQRGTGPRIMFSHIDGDGFSNTHKGTYDVISAERIYKLLKKLNFPISVSFILNEILPEYNGREYTMALADRIIRLKNVELASHTVNHPYIWDMKNKKKNTITYIRHSYLHDFRFEIKGSIDLINKRFSKSTRMLFWSGDCEPTMEHLEFCRESGILNINGGDTRYDNEVSGYFFVSPPYVKIGTEIQVHTGASNENLYTNLWRGPFDGFKKVIDTFKNTGKKYVTSPIDIYFHFYSGSRMDSLGAVKEVFDWTAK
ncbi:hypothetical protein KAJ27_20090, partial [bacterium]|nr:hypothetical protein [bacterium]